MRPDRAPSSPRRVRERRHPAHNLGMDTIDFLAQVAWNFKWWLGALAPALLALFFVEGFLPASAAPHRERNQ